MAKILKDRPESKIRVCGLAAESADSAGIQKQAPAAGKEEPPADEAEEDAAPVEAAANQTGALISKEQLEALAKARSDGIKDHLVNQHGIKADRILICHPEIDKTADGKPRAEILF